MTPVRTALITGGASGIGAALAGELARRGARVVIADIDEAQAARTARELSASLPGVVTPAGLDVRDGPAVRALVESVNRDQGLDLMVNNAGIGVGGRAEELRQEHWARQLDVNLWGVIHGASAAYPLMRSRGHGQILNTASLAGLVPSPGLLAYATSKFAVVGLTLALRAEAAPYGVQVAALCPGWVDTALLDAENPPDLPPVSPRRPLRQVIQAARLGRPVPPQVVAVAALHGLDRNRALIVLPGIARGYWWTHRYAPALADRLASAVATRMARPPTLPSRV